MPEYKFNEDKWEEVFFSRPPGNWNDQQLPMAIEKESAYLFRDDSGKIVHRYPLFEQQDLLAFSNVLRYFKTNTIDDIHYSSIKGRLLYSIDLCLQKISKIRDRVSFLEIGSTLCENYMLIKRLIIERGYPLSLNFVGIELSPNKSQAALLFNKYPTDLYSIAGDASDLSRFPDQSFDFIINHGVANHVYKPMEAFSEIVRVARLAVIMAIHTTSKKQPYYLTYSSGMKTFIVTPCMLEETWKKFTPLYDYIMRKIDWADLDLSGSGSQQFVGVDVAGLDSFYEYHILARQPIFPELSEICQIIK